MGLHNDFLWYLDHPADPVYYADKAGWFLCVKCSWGTNNGERICPKCGSRTFEDMGDKFWAYVRKCCNRPDMPMHYKARK